jgi:hypothetical protein
MYYLYPITLLYMRIALMNQSVACRVQIRRSRRAVAWCSLIVTRSWTRPWPWPAWPPRCTRSSPSWWLWGGGSGHPSAPRPHFHRPRAPQRPCAVGAQPSDLDFEPNLGRRRAVKTKNTFKHSPRRFLGAPRCLWIHHHRSRGCVSECVSA